MRTARVWQRLLGLSRVVIESVRVEDDSAGGDLLVVAVRPRRGEIGRCGRCRLPARGYDRGRGRRRWRHLDMGTIRTVIEADVRRVDCRVHGPTVAAVPWARHGSRFTQAFEDTCAWLTARTAATTVAGLLRVSWRAVVGVVERVVAEAAGRSDRLDGLRRIGIDEVAYRKGQRYLLVTWNQAAWLRATWWRYDDHDRRAAEMAGAGSA